MLQVMSLAHVLKSRNMMIPQGWANLVNTSSSESTYTHIHTEQQHLLGRERVGSLCWLDHSPVCVRLDQPCHPCCLQGMSHYKCHFHLAYNVPSAIHTCMLHYASHCSICMVYTKPFIQTRFEFPTTFTAIL